MKIVRLGTPSQFKEAGTKVREARKLKTACAKRRRTMIENAWKTDQEVIMEEDKIVTPKQIKQAQAIRNRKRAVNRIKRWNKDRVKLYRERTRALSLSVSKRERIYPRNARKDWMLKNMPDDLRTEFMALCQIQGINANDMVIDLIHRYLHAQIDIVDGYVEGE